MPKLKICVDVQYDKIGRVYIFDDGTRYHSVTTMLGATGDKEFLEDWKRRVGAQEAERIANEAAAWGEDYHQLGEDWLNGVPLTKNLSPISERIFKGTYRVLRDHVTEVIGVEDTLYTSKYMLAGRADAIVMWDGELMILDFKLLKHHNNSWLADYWMQVTIYAQCWYEMYGVMPKRAVLVVGNKEDKRTRFFISRTKPWQRKVNLRVKQFKAQMVELGIAA